MSYVTGSIIRSLREKKKLTQRELAAELCISEKTVSKWETGKGLPDIGILSELSKSLNVSIAELLTGELVTNRNCCANMKKQSFYVCPLCGNVIQSVGEGVFSCCGITLPVLEAEEELYDGKSEITHHIEVEEIENEYYVHVDHPMDKGHYISFIAYVTSDSTQMLKLYPEQGASGRFARRGGGIIYAYCNRHGLYVRRLR